MLAITPLRIYKTGETPRRPFASQTKDTEIERLKAELKKHKEAERRIKMHVNWILRSTQATHKDAKDIAQIVSDVFE
jgi:hypothetical protein